MKYITPTLPSPLKGEGIVVAGVSKIFREGKLKERHKYGLLAVCFFLCTLVFADEVKPIFAFPGGLKTSPGIAITPKDLAPVSPEGKFFTESWTFVYYTDDGGGGYIQYSIARVGYTIHQIGAHHTHYSGDGKMYYQKEILGPRDLKWDDKGPRLTMANSEWDGFCPRIHVNLPLPGLETDMNFNCLVGPWRPGTGPTHYGSPDGDWYNLIVATPLARIDGTIKVEGREKKVTGWGYVDHASQTIFFNSQAEVLYALRSFNNNWAIHFLDYHTPAEFGHKRVCWIMVIKDDKIVYVTDKFEVQPSEWTTEPRRNRKYPTRVKVTVNEPDFSIEADMKASRLFDVLDFRDQVPAWIEPAVGKLMRQPATIRQKVEFNWKVKWQGKEEIVPAKGIFEYTIVEKG